MALPPTPRRRLIVHARIGAAALALSPVASLALATLQPTWSNIRRMEPVTGAPRPVLRLRQGWPLRCHTFMLDTALVPTVAGLAPGAPPVTVAAHVLSGPAALGPAVSGGLDTGIRTQNAARLVVPLGLDLPMAAANCLALAALGAAAGSCAAAGGRSIASLRRAPLGPRCRACGYDLRRLGSAVCPECGWVRT